jgi:hypothetical protein
MRIAAVAAVMLGLAACSAAPARPAAAPTPHRSSATPSVAATATAATATPQLHVRRAFTLPAGTSRAVVLAAGSSRLLVLGGLVAGDSTTSRVWSVDVGTGAATSGGRLAQAVHDASGALLGGAAYVFGGGAATTVSSVQQYANDATRAVGALPQPRSDSAAAVVGNTAYVVGGFDGSHLVRDVVATSNGRSFRTVARLRVGVRYPAVAAVGSRILVVGGALATTEGTSAGPITDDIQQIDVTTGVVRVIGHLPVALAHAAAVNDGGTLLVIGGRRDGMALRTVYEVDPASGSVRLVGRLPRGVSDASAVDMGRTVWLVGGETTGPLAPSRDVLQLQLS